MSIRPVKRLIQARPTLEGAGVHLRRAFGFGDTEAYDPFLAEAYYLPVIPFRGHETEREP